MNENKFTHGSLFSGIGGFDLAAEWMGWDNIFHCEWNPFGQQILKHYWPNAKSYHDITKTDFTIHRGTIDILTGGFPCQPYSTAGKQRGTADERHLWPEMLRSIREVQPKWVIGENVSGLINWNRGLVFEQVQIELEAQGYEVIPFILPAAGVGAPHRRERVWFIAYTNSNGWKRSDSEYEFDTSEGRQYALSDISSSIENEPTAYSNSLRLQRSEEIPIRKKSIIRDTWSQFPTQSPICNGDDGLSTELDGITFSKWRNESIKAGGNAIVPQLALQIFKAIEQFENYYI